MSTIISSNNPPKLPQASGKPGASQAAAAGGNAAGASAGAPASQGHDQVRLTDSAMALREAARTGDSPEVDATRVEHIRQSIADGSYQVDAGHIADQLLSMEGLIGGAGGA